MTSLLTNTAAMTALTTLKGINQQLDATSNRVSTGQKVSAASDNAAYWSIATTVRTDNASLSAVKDSLGLGSSAVDTAYNGLNSALSDLQNMRAKLQTAMQPGVDRSKVQTEIAAIQSKMKATADSSNSSGQNWLSVNSSSANTAYQATQNVIAGFARDASGAISFSKVEINVSSIKLYDTNATNVATSATAAKVVGSTSLTGTAAFTNGTIDFNTADANGKFKQVVFQLTLDGGESINIQLDKKTLASTAKDLNKVTTDEILSAINNQISASGSGKLAGKVSAGLDEAGRLSFQTTGTGVTARVSLQVAAAVASGSLAATSFALADIGFGSTPGTAATAATSPSLVGTAVTAGKTYNLTTTPLTFTIDDGVSAKTITLDDTPVSGVTVTSYAAATQAEMVNLINAKLTSAGSTASVSNASDTFTLTSTRIGPTAKVTVTGADAAALGFVSGASDAGDAATPGSKAFTGFGTAAGTSTGQGILDTTAGTYSASFGGANYSIANIDISKLVGTDGDKDLAAIITAVDRAIAKVTDAGTKLGASKTQIDGQKTFVDTLMKANDRTIGTLVDADIEEESTKLKALQTQQQLAVQSLSIANSSSQNILSLFR